MNKWAVMLIIGFVSVPVLFYVGYIHSVELAVLDKRMNAIEDNYYTTASGSYYKYTRLIDEWAKTGRMTEEMLPQPIYNKYIEYCKTNDC